MFSRYATETLLGIHTNLENGVTTAVDVFVGEGPRSGYAVDSYHLSLAMLAGVEDELFTRGINPHE